MAAILQSLERTIIAGLVLLIAIIVWSAALISGQFVRPDHAWWTFVMRWLHVMSGVMWIGLLWYFNFVQIPTVPKIEPVEHRAAITKYHRAERAVLVPLRRRSPRSSPACCSPG